MRKTLGLLLAGFGFQLITWGMKLGGDTVKEVIDDLVEITPRKQKEPLT